MKKQHGRGTLTYSIVLTGERATGSGSDSQSGDNHRLSDVAEAGPESVEELVEERPVL
jgi:hypothetical protein